MIKPDFLEGTKECDSSSLWLYIDDTRFKDSERESERNEIGKRNEEKEERESEQRLKREWEWKRVFSEDTDRNMIQNQIGKTFSSHAWNEIVTGTVTTTFCFLERTQGILAI